MKCFIVLAVLLQLGLCIRPSQSGGVGFAFSGAGGRIAQHLAMLQSLITGTNPAGLKVRPDFISGASSGSITCVALNALLYNLDHNNETGFDWNEYEELLFTMTSGTVYDNSWEGMAKILTVNIFEGYFLDNTPLVDFLGMWFQKMGLNKLGDLYIPTAISVVNQSSGDSIRLWSDDPQYADLDLLEVIMASASMPMAFTPRTITGFGDTLFIDGGTGIDTLPVYALLHEANVTELYVICYSGAFSAGGGALPYDLSDILLLSNAIATIDDMRVDLFNGGIDMAARSNVPSWLYMPDLNMTWSALDFNDEKQEYTLASEWAQLNNPQPLNFFKREA